MNYSAIAVVLAVSSAAIVRAHFPRWYRLTLLVWSAFFLANILINPAYANVKDVAIFIIALPVYLFVIAVGLFAFTLPTVRSSKPFNFFD